jgi:hypothetical protein
MRSADEPIGHRSSSSSTPEPTQDPEAPRLAQQQIEEEVERILQKSTIATLCALFDPQELASANIARMWRYHQQRSQYKDFVHRWAQADFQEKAEVEFWYAYWYQEKRILERIADHRGIGFESAAADDGTFCSRLLRFTAHVCLEANLRPCPHRYASAETNVKVQGAEETSLPLRTKCSDTSTVLVALWRWGKAWFQRHAFGAWGWKGQHHRLEEVQEKRE